MHHGGYWDLPWMLAALAEELGELSRAIQAYGNLRMASDSFMDQTSRRKKHLLLAVTEECGDLFFALLCLTNALSINLEEAVLKTLEKYSSRKDP